jgi:hypothetical protein
METHSKDVDAAWLAGRNDRLRAKIAELMAELLTDIATDVEVVALRFRRPIRFADAPQNVRQSQIVEGLVWGPAALIALRGCITDRARHPLLNCIVESRLSMPRARGTNDPRRNAFRKKRAKK